MMTSKRCPECDTIKLVGLFYPDVNKGVSTYCKECTKIRNAKWIKANRNKHRAYQRKGYEYTPKDKRDRRQYYIDNKEHHQKVNKEWRLKNPDKERAGHLKRNYGLTLEQYEQILQTQGGCCAICKRAASDFPRNLAVDHNHQTLEVRGVLCGHCNHRIIGRHREGRILRAAADYLDTAHTGLFVPPKKRKKRASRKRT